MTIDQAIDSKKQKRKKCDDTDTNDTNDTNNKNDNNEGAKTQEKEQEQGARAIKNDNNEGIEWVTILSKYQLMKHAHFENDAQKSHVIQRSMVCYILVSYSTCIEVNLGL